MKMIYEDTKKEIKEDIEISASKQEIKMAILFLQDLLKDDALLNELIFHNDGTGLRVTKSE